MRTDQDVPGLERWEFDSDDEDYPIFHQEGESRKRAREMEPTEEDIVAKMRLILDDDPFRQRAPRPEARHMRALFGVSTLVILTAWKMMTTMDIIPEGGTIKHFLWMLMYLKVYPTEVSFRQLTRTAPNTLRKWVNAMLDAVIQLEPKVIKFRNRFKEDIGNDCLMTVDGTDFRVAQSGRKFYSHKFKKSALRYECGVSILKGDLCWINGPYEAGKWPDINIFRNSLMSHLGDGERVEADEGYYGECPAHCKCPGHVTADPETAEMQAVARKRHETINKRFKQWGILKQVYRSKQLHTHGRVFVAVATLTQLQIQLGEPLFQVDYADPYWNDLDYFEFNKQFDEEGNYIGEGDEEALEDNNGNNQNQNVDEDMDFEDI